MSEARSGPNISGPMRTVRPPHIAVLMRATRNRQACFPALRSAGDSPIVLLPLAEQMLGARSYKPALATFLVVAVSGASPAMRTRVSRSATASLCQSPRDWV
jgi:hypothetical protein